ncbi:MAG TPA: DUF362 domain-containing protein [Candidatus Ratteibacteria bacterium]|nr:DUF362 domain-containing protein [bacterium]HOQ82255.1 DUF362 domain-containing protein [bacterium]HRS07107.1 DUF362 domain-containing protein [Candidatus Ratteibacteria bacterium]HRV04228.1 DUF362 domain-containing protein [Candidatus Ratteibacteria bacterium]
MDRKEFLKRSVAAAAGILLAEHSKIFRTIPADAQVQQPTIYVSKDKSPSAMVSAVVAAMGGMGKFIKKGSKVTIKPNIAWNRTPEQAATTNPEVVSTLVKMCLDAGASSVVVTDLPCNPWQVTYVTSGIKEAVERAGGIIKSPSKFRKVQIPSGIVLKEAEILEDVLDADVFINVPIVKVHGSQAKITISMKNFMGIVKDRGYFHRTDLNQCIADICSYLKPALTVVDATRILLTNGPQGPGSVKETKMVFAGTDFVALDAFGSTLLGVNPADVRHIQIAEKMGLGQSNLSKIKIRYV